MTTAADASGNGHTGTYLNNPTLGVAGLVVGDADTAVAFAASPNDQYVVQDDTILAQSFSALTLGCIIKPTTPTDPNTPYFFGIHGATNDNINFFQNADGTITFFAKDGVGAINGFLLNSVTVLSAGAVYRLIGTWDGTTAKLYINGALDASVGYANAVTLAAAEKVFFGADQFNTTGNASWNGVGDEAFFIPNHAATGGEIATIDAAMTGTGSVSAAINALSPYIYWRLGEMPPPPTVGTGTLRSLTIGADSPYEIEPPGVGGLGSPPVKSADTQFDGRDGSAGAPDFDDVRVITIPLAILGDTPDDAMTKLDALNTAFAPTRDGVNIALHLVLPGWGDRYWLGRPRGVDVDLSDMKSSTLHALCRFDALDPAYHTP